MHRRGGQKEHGLGIVAEIADAPVQVGLGVADVVGFIDDHKVELGRRIQGQEALDSPLAAAGFAMNKVRVEQGKGQNRFGVFVGPFSLQFRLAQAVSEQLAIQRLEVFIETLHLQRPLALGDQRLRTDDQDGRKVHTRA